MVVKHDTSAVIADYATISRFKENKWQQATGLSIVVIDRFDIVVFDEYGEP